MLGKNVLKMTANDWIEEAKNWPWIKDEPIEHLAARYYGGSPEMLKYL